MKTKARSNFFLGALSCLLLLLAIGSCGNDQSGSPSSPGSAVETFRIATITWVGYGPIYLAQEKDFFEGIDVEIERIDDTAARRAALVSGQIQGSVDIVDSFVNAAASGLDASVVLKLDDSMGGDGILVRKDVDRLQDLRGKSVAYPEGQPSHFFLLALLDEAGMSVDDIESRLMEADQAGAAFIGGAVDAAVTWEPWLKKAVDSGQGKILTSSRTKPGLIVDVFTVRNDYLRKHPEAVKEFIRGWYRAVEYWKANKEESNAIMAQALGIEPVDFVTMVKGVRYSDRESNVAFFSDQEAGSSAFSTLVARANDVWSREGVIKSPVAPAAIDGSATLLSLAP